MKSCHFDAATFSNWSYDNIKVYCLITGNTEKKYLSFISPFPPNGDNSTFLKCIFNRNVLYI